MLLIKKIIILFLCLGIIGYIFLWIWSAIVITPARKIPQKREGTLRILMANVNYRNTQKTVLTKKFIDLNVDVGVILEWTGKSLDQDLLFKADYTMPVDCQVPNPSPHGIGTFVRCSLVPKATVIYSHIPDACRMPMATLQINFQDTCISIIGLHTPPPLLKCYKQTPKRIDEITDSITNGYLDQKIGACQPNEPLIIAGDLNMPPYFPSVKTIKKKGMIEAYDMIHKLPPVSWSLFSWFPPFIRLDYIYCSERLKVINACYINIPGSDHKGMIVDFKI